MTCRDATDFLVDYVAGELDKPVLETFERHLAACPNCREFLVEYRATIRACRGAYKDDVAGTPLPDDLVKAILASFEHTKTQT